MNPDNLCPGDRSASTLTARRGAPGRRPNAPVSRRRWPARPAVTGPPDRAPPLLTGLEGKKAWATFNLSTRSVCCRCGVSNVDTDQILPRSLKRAAAPVLDGLFAALARDPSFFRNETAYQGARSWSRYRLRHQVRPRAARRALVTMVSVSVVAPRFRDIFRINSTKAGLLPVQLPEETSPRCRFAERTLC